jgi:hypothetical protein
MTNRKETDEIFKFAQQKEAMMRSLKKKCEGTDQARGVVWSGELDMALRFFACLESFARPRLRTPHRPQLATPFRTRIRHRER